MIDQDTKNKLRAEVMAELAALPVKTFCERLRGIYRIPINDGAGPLNGSMEFVREFETGPIQHEAARKIEFLLGKLAEITYSNAQCSADAMKMRNIASDVVSNEHHGLPAAHTFGNANCEWTKNGRPCTCGIMESSNAS